MKTKIVIITVLIMLLIANFSVSGFTIQKNKMQCLKDPTPQIYFIAVYTSCKQVDSGYTNIMYKAYSENEIGGIVDMVFDWGDGTISTFPDVKGGVYENHIFERSGNFNIKVRYGKYNSWSDPVEFSVIDHCDLDIIDVFTDPIVFGKKDKIDIKATVRNEGTISTTQNTKLKLFEGFDKYRSDNPIKEISAGLINPGEEVTITLEDFKWYGDLTTHSFLASVEPVSGEIDWTTLADNINDPNLNNVCDGHFTAPKINSILNIPVLSNLIIQFPLFQRILNL